jgi:hypothetical protein
MRTYEIQETVENGHVCFQVIAQVNGEHDEELFSRPYWSRSDAVDDAEHWVVTGDDTGNW